MEKHLHLELPPVPTAWPATTPPKSPNREVGKTKFLRKRKIGRSGKVGGEKKAEESVTPFQFQVSSEAAVDIINTGNISSANDESITNGLHFSDLKL